MVASTRDSRGPDDSSQIGTTAAPERTIAPTPAAITACERMFHDTTSA